MNQTPPTAKPILTFIRALAECYQAFAKCSNQQVQEYGLTPAQFDVLATLGNTNGMTCKELGEKTLITKGTLTGVVDRMIEKGWASRQAMGDKRCVRIALTEPGQALFAEIFPRHLAHLQQSFQSIPEETLLHAAQQLVHIKSALKQDDVA